MLKKKNPRSGNEPPAWVYWNLLHDVYGQKDMFDDSMLIDSLATDSEQEDPTIDCSDESESGETEDSRENTDLVSKKIKVERKVKKIECQPPRKPESYVKKLAEHIIEMDHKDEERRKQEEEEAKESKAEEKAWKMRSMSFLKAATHLMLKLTNSDNSTPQSVENRNSSQRKSLNDTEQAEAFLVDSGFETDNFENSNPDLDLSEDQESYKENDDQFGMSVRDKDQLSQIKTTSLHRLLNQQNFNKPVKTVPNILKKRSLENPEIRTSKESTSLKQLQQISQVNNGKTAEGSVSKQNERSKIVSKVLLLKPQRQTKTVLEQSKRLSLDDLMKM